MLDELKISMAEKGIRFDYKPDAAKHIAENSYSHKFGARNMRRYISRNVEDLLAEAIIADYDKQITAILLKRSKKDNKLIIECLK